MSVQRCSLVGLLGLTFLFSASLERVWAQTSRPGDFKITNIQKYLRHAPDFSGAGQNLGGKGQWANSNWLYVEVDFDSALEWADDVSLRYYVQMHSGREVRLFTGDITHSNVKKGPHHYSAMFMHPSTVDRYGLGKVDAVAVQLLHQGRLMGQMSEPPSATRWWETLTPVEGFLLRPNQTPWSVLAFQRFEAEKPAPKPLTDVFHKVCDARRSANSGVGPRRLHHQGGEFQITKGQGLRLSNFNYAELGLDPSMKKTARRSSLPPFGTCCGKKTSSPPAQCSACPASRCSPAS